MVEFLSKANKDRSSRMQMTLKVGVFKNFAIHTAVFLCFPVFFIEHLW